MFSTMALGGCTTSTNFDLNYIFLLPILLLHLCCILCTLDALYTKYTTHQILTKVPLSLDFARFCAFFFVPRR